MPPSSRTIPRPLVAALAVLGALLPGSALAQPQSDDFNAPALEGFWTFQNPLGDGSFALTGVGSGDAKLALSVPAGTAHEGTNVVEVVQPTADVDFEVEVKFDSALTARRQDQGLRILEDAGRYLNLRFYRTSTVRIAAETVANGASTLHNQLDIPASSTFYMRVGRTGSLWTQTYSFDGISWFPAGSFTSSLTPNAVSVFAGTGGTNPAHTAVVDYFFNTAAPLVPEDGPRCTEPGPFELSVSFAGTGSGSVAVDPDQASYDCGDVVSLQALPDPGARFVGWSGDASGTASPVAIAMNGDRSVTATFDLDTTPPVVSNLQVQPGQTSAVVSWTTDEPASSRVDYGTAAPDEAFVEDGAPKTAHSLMLGDLSPETIYQFTVTSVDESGNPATTTVDDFATLAEGGGGGGGAIQSDDFNTANLKSFWTLVNPLGDGTVSVVGAGSGEASLQLSVPGGSAHEGANVLQLVQPAENTDFEIEAKFDSPVTTRRREQGIRVNQDADDYLSFRFYGKNNTVVRIVAETVANGAATTHYQFDVGSTVPQYLRVTRTGNLWTLRYSLDGQSWIQAGTNTSVLAVAEVGVFAGNGGTNPAHTAIVDYFFNTALPVVPEDPIECGAPGPFALDLVTTGNGSVSAAPDLPTYECGAAVTLTATPAVGWKFDGWSGDLGGSTNPVTLNVGADLAITANFVEDLPTGDGPTIELFYGDTQSFGQIGLPQTTINVLGNTSDPQGVASLQYSLNGGPLQPLTVGLGGNPRLVRVGDFNVDLPASLLVPGSNELLLRAQDNQGNVSFRSVALDFTTGVFPPLVPQTVDFAAASAIDDVAQVVDGKWALVPGGVRILETGYDRILVVGDLSWGDFEATMEFTVNAVGELKSAPLLGVATRWNGHFDWAGEQPDVGWYPGAFGGLGTWRWLPDGCVGVMIIGTDGNRKGRNCNVPPIALGVPHKMKVRGEPVSANEMRYYIKVWPSAGAEPGWQLNRSSGLGVPASGSLLITAHYVDVTLHGVTITPLP